MNRLLGLYLSIRKPRNFLILLCTFIGTTLILHLMRGYDSDFGATNLILSIEASVAGAVLMLVAEESAAHQRAHAEALTRTLAAVLAISKASEKTLSGVLLVAEAQRDLLIDNADIMRMLHANDAKILSTLEGAHNDEAAGHDQKAANGLDH